MTEIIKGHKNLLNNDLLDILALNPLFSTLDNCELEQIITHLNIVKLKKGEILFREGDKGNYACFLVSGEMDIVKDSVYGYVNVLASLNKGQSIGEMSIIDNTSRYATLLARTEASIITLTQADFNLILEKYTKTGIKILKGIARLLSINMQKVSGRLSDYMQPLH
ncbi:Cyclic nucleotide-binding domain-containing protein [Desulfonema limicola]|uniref:Cyclic nucleotide-binding domain-containing protein n=1 Tax=Desulfonema limicola TaxID=45656 RepID=A0A975B5D7_9BACT|nr:cyclic nucleotide-binding domain-containing protein [Desulfonema limicola]QTA79126.1 Cyclic nucleotide-binding domain-containing protein [Desulfonema limicola]